jgi:type IV pilus assembly protein PilA
MLKSLREKVGARLSERAEGESGFTLVELLVVMLILGLLAAIAIPSFFNQTDKANDASAKVQARTAETAMETYRTDHNGSYAGADGAALHTIENTVPAATTVTFPGGGVAYTVTSPAAANTGNTFSITRNTDGSKTSDCTTHNTGGCPSNGHWAG